MATNRGQLLDSESDEELDSYPDVATRAKHKPQVPIEAQVRISSGDVFDDTHPADRDLGAGGFQSTSQRAGPSFSRSEGRPKAESTSSAMDFGSEENISQFKSEALFWLRHPRIRENCKTVTAAFLLFFAGIAFAVTGIVLASSGDSDDTKSIIFFVCAGICLLPGAYHIIYIYRATKGQKGYNFESIPSFQ